MIKKPTYDKNAARTIRGEAVEKEIKIYLEQNNFIVENVWKDILEPQHLENVDMASQSKFIGDLAIPYDEGKIYIEVKTTKDSNRFFSLDEGSLRKFVGDNKYYCLALVDEEQNIMTSCCFIPSFSLKKYMEYKELKKREEDGWEYRMLPTGQVSEKKFRKNCGYSVDAFATYLLGKYLFSNRKD